MVHGVDTAELVSDLHELKTNDVSKYITIKFLESQKDSTAR